MPLFEEEFTVDGTAEAVWDFLLDPKRLAPCMPGCESVEVEDSITYRVRLGKRFAPPQDVAAFNAELDAYYRRELIGALQSRWLQGQTRA